MTPKKSNSKTNTEPDWVTVLAALLVTLAEKGGRKKKPAANALEGVPKALRDALATVNAALFEGAEERKSLNTEVAGLTKVLARNVSAEPATFEGGLKMLAQAGQYVTAYKSPAGVALSTYLAGLHMKSPSAVPNAILGAVKLERVLGPRGLEPGEFVALLALFVEQGYGSQGDVCWCPPCISARGDKDPLATVRARTG